MTFCCPTYSRGSFSRVSVNAGAVENSVFQAMVKSISGPELRQAFAKIESIRNLIMCCTLFNLVISFGRALF